MDNNVVHNLREWAPLTVLDKIPTRILNGLFPSDLNITCIDAIAEYLVLGTDGGLVFWYNRYNAECQKLRIEVSSLITCIKIVSSVEYMIAVGTRNGQVNVFQIQKEIPPDLKLSAPLARSKPIQRYTIRNLHKSPVTCCEWSKNGMKLFSADKHGIVVLTEFDYQNNLSKSIEILNETYSIVQLSIFQSYLLVSTLYRTTICEPNRSLVNDGKWRIRQVGKTGRKILGEFGATFHTEELKPTKMIACRPGFRFWFANCDGVVEKTFIFKDAPLMRPSWEIPLLNPNRKSTNVHLKNFTCIFPYLKNFYVTKDDVSLYILNLEDLKIEAIARNFRKIIDYAICDNEIFVLEGGRSLIRLSNKPEPPSQKATIIFNPLLPPPIPHMGIFEAPIEFTEDEIVIGAEECFELPPIEPISSDILIQTHIDSPDTETKKIVEESKKRIEILQKIGEQAFEEQILFRTEKSKKPLNQKNKTKNLVKSEGIVEIGHTVISDESEIKNSPSASEIGTGNTSGKNKRMQITTKPEELDASFCTESTIQQIEENTADPIKLIESITENFEHKPTSSNLLFEPDASSLQFPKWPSLNYPISASNIESINSPESVLNKSENLIENINDLLHNEDNQNRKLSVNVFNSASLLHEITSLPENKDVTPKEVASNFNVLSPDLGGRGDQLKSEDMPKHLKIPSIFNLKNEKCSNNSDTDGSNSNESHTSEWEFITDVNIKKDDSSANNFNK